MLGRFFQRDPRVLTASEKARLLHGRWLTRALGSRRQPWPVIPLRRVSEGGFSPLMSSREGRAWAEAWWESTLGLVPEEL